jgi:5'-3' exonuclease
VSKAIRKDYFGCPVDELEKWLPPLLENMKFTGIKVQGATRKAVAQAKEKITLQNGTVEVDLDLNITWTEQSEGVTFIVTASEPKFDWTSCLCNRAADNVLGAMRTICEIYHGKDA